MKLIAKVTLRAGGESHPPGAEVTIDDERECARLIAGGFAVEAVATEAEAVSTPETSADVAIEAEPDGSLSDELTGDGSGEALPEIDPEPPKARKKGRR